MKYSFYIFLLVLWTGLSGNVFPSDVEIADTSFASKVQLSSGDATLQGVSLLRYKNIFKLYSGALYLGDDGSTFPVNRSGRFEVEYLRNINAQDLVTSGQKNLEAKYPIEKLASIQDRLDQMNTWWKRTMYKGDRAAISYIPGKGTSLEINGELQGTIPGEDFAEMYFSIWFGPGEVDARFRRELLGSD